MTTIPGRIMDRPTPEDVLARILGEGDARAGENTLYVEAEIELSDGEMELVLEMLDEIRAIKNYQSAGQETWDD